MLSLHHHIHHELETNESADGFGTRSVSQGPIESLNRRTRTERLLSGMTLLTVVCKDKAFITLYLMNVVTKVFIPWYNRCKETELGSCYVENISLAAECRDLNDFVLILREACMPLVERVLAYPVLYLDNQVSDPKI